MSLVQICNDDHLLKLLNSTGKFDSICNTTNFDRAFALVCVHAVAIKSELQQIPSSGK